MPVYNVKKYLDRSILSVLNQSFKDIEFIIINDGSTDGSHETIDSYLKKDKRIKYIHQANKGVSTARNIALSMALGDYVYFIDADDYIDKNLLLDMVSQIDKFNPDIIFFGYEMDSVRSGRKIDKIPYETSYLNRAEFVTNFGLIENSVDINSLWNKVYSNSFLSEIGAGFPDMSVGEDAVFNYYCLQNVRDISLVKEKYYYYSFERPGSAINTVSLGRMRQRLRVINEYEHLCNVLNIRRQEVILQKRVNCFFGETKTTLFSKDILIVLKIKNLARIKTELIKYHLFNFNTLFKVSDYKSKIKLIFCLFVLSMIPWRNHND